LEGILQEKLVMDIAAGQPERYMTADDQAAALTHVELAMIRAVEAFGRWCVFLNKASSGDSLSHQDVWLLHSIRMRDGAQNLSELMLFLNRSDVSTIQYSLKKLEQFGLVERVVGRSKREAGYRLTERGIEVTNIYASVRQEILVKLLGEIRNFLPALESAAATLERLTGLYDQGTQSVLNRKILGV
jgi:predicted MarR family transcription regulator